ncbi:MAG: Tol-Pal system beta propeller repeat protein TolB [Rickettsiales bacterium]|jgi:TolB protein|nr:Tol-Pal system beta propeller repeat protein TolB [Rickettsiales bacterium]
MIKKIFVFSLFFAMFSGARAEIVVDIVAGNTPQIPVAIVPFETADATLKADAKMLNQVLAQNLERTGLFKILDPESFPETLKFGELPSFEHWKLIKAKALVQAKLSKASNNNLRLQFFLWDVDSGEQIEAQSLVASVKSKRRLAHISGDEIYKRLTGEGGYFDTQIVYIAESGPVEARIRRLAIMDQDGHNNRYISSPDVYVTSPYFSPNMHTLVFLSYRNDDPAVWTLDLSTGEQRKLGKFSGMTFAPAFSPDGNKVAMSLVDDMAINLYEYDMEKKTLRQLTYYDGIDTSPSYSPDGKSLVFNSDRSGSQQLHILDLSTLDAHRISFGSGRYATPSWSPRGDYIAFTRILSDTFSIGVMTPKGKSEKILASGWFMESPNWAPNGRRVVFHATDKSKDGMERSSEIISVDITGQNSYHIKTPGNAVSPSWSPLLP